MAAPLVLLLLLVYDLDKQLNNYFIDQSVQLRLKGMKHICIYPKHDGAEVPSMLTLRDTPERAQHQRKKTMRID